MSDLTQAEFDALPDNQDQEVLAAHEVCLEASGLRQMADVLDRLKAAGASYFGGVTMHVVASDAEEFRRMSRALGTFQKVADDNYFHANRTFDGEVKLSVFVGRSKLCKRILLRTEDVPEQIIPEVPAVPAKVIPASKREVYGWECTPSVLTVEKQAAIVSEPVPVAALTADDDLPF